MNKAIVMTTAIAMLALGGCNNSPSEKLADRVESAADTRAEAMEAHADSLETQADMLDSRAEQVRDLGESRANAIEAADTNAKAMTQEQRDAIVANKAPAVR